METNIKVLVNFKGLFKNNVTESKKAIFNLRVVDMAVVVILPIFIGSVVLRIMWINAIRNLKLFVTLMTVAMSVYDTQAVESWNVILVESGQIEGVWGNS